MLRPLQPKARKRKKTKKKNTEKARDKTRAFFALK